MKLALLIELSDYGYVPYIKPMLVGHQVSIIQRCPDLISEISTKFDAGIVVRQDFLKKLTFGAKGSSLENFAGSLLSHNATKLPIHKKEFIVLDPLEQICTTRTGEFLTERYLSKILRPEIWWQQTEFNWEIAHDDTVDKLYDKFSTADIIAVDIETTTDGTLLITCVGYCGIWFNSDGSISTRSIVLPFTSMFWIAWVRKFNTLPQPKIFQNGQFDNQFFLRFGCPIINWAYDTQELFHAWYSELPKRLDAISAFLIRDIYYWKQEGKTGNLEDYYRYNAKDTWATANSWLSAIAQVPDWALANFREKFPLVFPCLSCALEGIKVNADARTRMAEVQGLKLEGSLGKLRTRIGKSNFNPGSPKQVLSLIGALGYSKQFQNADKHVIAKVAKKHPLAQLLMEDILRYRESAKLLNTYIGAKLLNGRLLYSLNPSGTDTARLASTKSSFIGYGTQLQNIPEYVKGSLEADDEFYLFEIDNKYSESFCTGYLSGDENLISVLNSGKDFHAANVERFFGIPYAEIFNDSTGEVINKILRQLAKKTNHGATYNMGDTVLIHTMGAENVYKARELLHLPQEWGLLRIAGYLLERFDTAYPKVKHEWYDFIKASVKLTHLLVSALGWTRYCFGEPWKNKPDLNAYVAHPPQNLSVGIINRGFRRVFTNIQMAGCSKDFRLKGQIHDSILGQYRIGRLDLVARANELVKQSIPVQDCEGKTRIMRIPTDVKAEAKLWSDLKKVKM
jgi:hypothetical protein